MLAIAKAEHELQGAILALLDAHHTVQTAHVSVVRAREGEIDPYTSCFVSASLAAAATIGDMAAHLTRHVTRLKHAQLRDGNRIALRAALSAVVALAATPAQTPARALEDSGTSQLSSPLTL